MRTSHRWLVAAILTLGVLSTPYAVQAQRPGGQAPPACHRLFWMKEGIRYARHIWAGTHHATKWQRHRIWHMDLCQHNPHARRYLRRVIRREEKANHRISSPAHWPQALASWYDDAGNTASGTHYTYGVADCGNVTGVLPCTFGARVEFCYHGCVVARVDDRGPYYGGRVVDLNQNTAAAIGFGGVGDVHYKVL